MMAIEKSIKPPVKFMMVSDFVNKPPVKLIMAPKIVSKTPVIVSKLPVKLIMPPDRDIMASEKLRTVLFGVIMAV